MPTLQPVDESFFSSAPKVFKEVFEIPRAAQLVWEEFVADGALGFCRMVSGATWTSPRPFGVGTTRKMAAGLGAIRLDEKYFIWEEGKRQAFYVERCNLPLFKRFAEDYVLEETSPTSCRFTWTIAVEESAAGKPGGPVNKMLIKSLFADVRKHFGAT